MEHKLDWQAYRDQGMGDAYADIPRQGGDFAKAVAVCIQSGVCEQQTRGVMCPSYRVTNDPALSPGGRVRLLKKLLNAEQSVELSSDPELKRAMDLCVACKGCKRECENNLDMSQIKVEFEAQQKRGLRKSLRNWLLAEWVSLLYRFPVLGWLILLHNRYRWFAKLSEIFVGLSPSVKLPVPAKQRFSAERRVYSPFSGKISSKSVVLWVDAFTALFHPQHADDALSLLRRAGYTVWVVHPFQSGGDLLDSGRSLISHGRVQRTKQEAQRLLSILLPHVRNGWQVVGLEPSSLLMLRDEYLVLGLGDEAKQVSESVLLFEEFVAREHKQGRFDIKFDAAKEKEEVLVHGHCHQKAVGAMKSVRRVLRLVPELRFDFIDSSCCGMAGSFGLHAEFAEVSRGMAELSLLPRLSENKEATVLCNGFSCSQQIANLDGRKPLHIASLLKSYVPPSEDPSEGA
ncbi:(Fe-S)-binding protein [Corallincola platygyrae]|uniref:(Fe-S)-binding protein n=1 Tax=Corallincola platygyrae TaxID=1193278 RepID=A0ABW4XRY5_9GAMM